MKKRFLLRLDPRIYRSVHRWADDDLRSVNAQIEYLLRRALKEAGRLDRPKVEETESPDPTEGTLEHPASEDGR